MLDSYWLEFGITDLRVVKEAKATKMRNGHRPQEPGTTDGPKTFPAVEGTAPIAGKTNKRYLRILFWACLSAVCLGAGSLACGLLAQEASVTKAILLFLAALAGAAGCLFFFYRCLREISLKPRGPFIYTLQ